MARFGVCETGILNFTGLPEGLRLRTCRSGVSSIIADDIVLGKIKLRYVG